MSWTDDAERMSAELRDELASNEARRRLVDPRTQPLRFHHLKAAGRSAAHAFESFQSDSDETLATRLGTGTHSILLGKPVKVWDQPSEASMERRKKAEAKGLPLPPITPAPRSGKEWDKFELANRGAALLLRSEHDIATRVATAILNNPEAAEWLNAPGVAYEQTILWSQGGRTRRSTPDLRCPVRITEVKTTKSAAPDQFKWDVKRYAYHAQLVDQRNATIAKYGEPPKELCIIAVEKKRPFVVQTYRLTERDIEQGEKLLRFWFEQYMNAERDDSWGGYAVGTLDLDLPGDDDEPSGIIFHDDESDPDEEADQ